MFATVFPFLNKFSLLSVVYQFYYVLQQSVTARTPVQPAVPPALMLPVAAAAAAAVSAVEEEEGLPEAEGVEAAVRAAPAARAASTTVMTWRLPTWRPQPSSTCLHAAEKCHKAWEGSRRTSAHR